MKTLIKGGYVVDVFSDSISKKDVLIENNVITGVGDYDDEKADTVINAEGKYLAPGFIDGHIHIESTMLTPYEFAKIAVLHGTTAVVNDPHEITNVCGTKGMDYMLDSSKGLPVTFYFTLPSCVPATGFDESFEEITADKMEKYFSNDRVLGLAEMMNYVGVVQNDEEVLKKIELAKKYNKVIDGHAPLISGKTLDKYIKAGIDSDHESTNLSEAMEKISKGQWVMIRNGSAAKNLDALADLIDSPCSYRCLFATDDKNAKDLISDGHIDSIIRKAIKLGKKPESCIRIASINAALRFGIKNVGAIAPGYKADINILENLEDVLISSVIKNGEVVVNDGILCGIKKPETEKSIADSVKKTINIKPCVPKDFYVVPKEGKKARVIGVIPGQIVTSNLLMDLNFEKNNGIDVERDILKIAVIERHKATGHIGIGYINGIGLKSGAIASTVSHDSHNIIVIGTSDEDMAAAVERILEIGGGNVIIKDRKVAYEIPLEIGGIMSTFTAEKMAESFKKLKSILDEIGINDNIEPFMNMAFVSLPVIPSLKLTTFGLFDVENFKLCDVFCD